jgi:Fe-S-cluster containining protein
MMTTPSEQTFAEYEQHVAAVDSEFRRVYELFSERMQCRRGCSMCCSQMFSISRIEAAYISRAVKSMPVEEQERLRSEARSYVEQASSLTGGEQGVQPRPGLRLPCPALKGDACTIYEARPIICRKWGIPLFNPKKPMELQACELNFRPGEEIEVEGLMEPQVSLLEEWVQIKDRARKHIEHFEKRVTVAEAILEGGQAAGLPTQQGDQG